MEYRRYGSEEDLPCAGQTAETIYAWASRLRVGDTVALRQSSAHTHIEYRLGHVEALTDEGRRVMVKNVGTFWRTAKSAGRNCFHPKGQLSMIEVTAAVVEAAEAKVVFTV